MVDQTEDGHIFSEVLGMEFCPNAEKAKKWNELAPFIIRSSASIQNQNKRLLDMLEENQKLRELIEQRLLELSADDGHNWDTDILSEVIEELNALLEKCKK